MSVVARDDETEQGGQPGGQVAAASSFTTRFKQLVSDVHPSGRGPYSMPEIADGVASVGGPEMTGGYYHHLLRGRRSNPTFDVVVGLARFFDVPLSYFAPHPDSDPEADLELRSAGTSRQMRDLIAKMQRVEHPNDIAAIRAIVDSFLRRDTDDAGT